MNKPIRILSAIIVTLVLGGTLAYEDIQKNGAAYRTHPLVVILTDFFGASLSGVCYYFVSGWFASRREEKLGQVGDDKFYDEVARELHEKSIVAGLWTRAYAEMGGDDAKTRALYIKYRVANLKEDAKNAHIKLQSEEKERIIEEAKKRETMKSRLMTICKKCGYAGCMDKAPSFSSEDDHGYLDDACKCPKCLTRFEWYYVPSKDFEKTPIT